jgi:hypothetical protein
MKSFVCLLASFCACVAFGGEFSSPEPQSVLKVEAPATVVVEAAPAAACAKCAASACDCCAKSAQPSLICVSGQCGSSRLYSVQAEEKEHCRNRLFGGHVVRKTQRTVVKPVRR